jgi:hypothetical protein
MTAAALLLEPLRCDPTPELERILKVDFATTQARAKGVAPSSNYEGGQTGATTTKTLSTLPSPTIDRVDICTTNWQRSTPLLFCS